MHRYLFVLLWLLLLTGAHAQTKKPQDFGFRHLNLVYQKDPVNVLVLSQKGHEQIRKPLFLFVQGSLPIPLLIYDEQGLYGTFPFETNALLQHYHLAIIGKPYIPVVATTDQLQANFTYLDPETESFPQEYTQRNLLDYYVARNLEVLRQLKSKEWISGTELVVAGHSEGSTIAAKMSLLSTDITHLIYSGGNPFGRIMSMLASSRSANDTTTEKVFSYWKSVVENSDSLSSNGGGDSPKTTFDFSLPPLQYLEKLEVPVLVVYGAKDVAAPFNDYLRVEMMRQQKANYTFKAFAGLEHNYFGLTQEGSIDYDNYNWDKVADAWLEWLTSKAPH